MPKPEQTGTIDSGPPKPGDHDDPAKDGPKMQQPTVIVTLKPHQLEWLMARAAANGRSPGQEIHAIVAEAWRLCPIRAARGGSQPYTPPPAAKA